MKIALLILTLLIVLMSFAWVNLPLLFLDLPDLAFGLSWIGMELMGLLVAVVVVFTLLVLISLGVIGFVLALFIGLIFTLIFQSFFIALPLLMFLAIAWLVTDKSIMNG